MKLGRRFRMETFNRTIVELKLRPLLRRVVVNLTFNRTIVELKPDKLRWSFT